MSRTVTDIAAATWRRLGVPREEALQMRRELEADLADAAAGGRTADEYVGGDPKGLARGWAAARGLIRPRYRFLRVAVSGLVGTLPGLAFALLLVVSSTSSLVGQAATGGVDSRVFITQPGASPQLAAGLDLAFRWTLAWYFVGGLFAYGGCLAAVSAALRVAADPGRRRTVAVLAVVFPVIAALTVTAAVVTAARAGFAYGVAIQLRTAAAGVVVLVFGLTIVRFATVLRQRRRPGTPAIG